MLYRFLTINRCAIKRFVILGWLVALAGIFWTMSVALAQQSSSSGREPLTIVSKSGVRHVFSVEIAVSSQERALGLMFRTSLEPMSGMVFEFNPPQPVAMWMKNTFISLDMIFIRQDGMIGRIAERTVPLSERQIVSGGDVVAVLEIAGGEAARLGISVGDMVEYRLFRMP